jgi:REP element-mobilizing transposase RayT
MADPLGFLLTWTTYGTWLHGDENGSVNRDNNVVGQPRIPANAIRVETLHAKLSQPPLTLDNAMRATAEAGIRAHADFRGWLVVAANVRTNHAHVVIGRTGEYHPDEILKQLKGAATRLLRSSGLVEPVRRVWTDGGSKRWLNDDDSFAKAVDYVLNRQ